MTIVHKAGNIPKNSDGLSKWSLPNTPEYVPVKSEPQTPIEVINITDVVTEFFKEVRESSLASSGLYMEKTYDNGRSHLFDGIWYHRSKNTRVMVLCSIILIDKILLEHHEKIYSGNRYEDRTMEIIKTCSLWSSWRKDVIEYCHNCDMCQKENKATGKIFGSNIHIQEPSTPCEVIHMDWVTALPPGGEENYNVCLVIVDKYKKTPILIPFHKYDTAMDTALLIWNRLISHTGLLRNIISYANPKFTSALWTNLNKPLATKLPFPTACHPQTDR
ncbi:hypothetical protein O181_055900 [Austropuccinia psidii MF-1]|uniref:Integrase catalytic domain-containing protein n=1 Tax=Austropuccinia psidii MF-1 TaxID=1389203 RepID=A0A9Q3EBP9_9BASI|nr:hypothetical protein [Austropuccinia psidii MF-1]